MKAWKFKLIRQDMKYYDVWIAIGYHFNIPDRPNVTLLARSPREAAERAYKKGFNQKMKFVGVESDSINGYYAVRLHEKQSIKFVTYWI